MNTETCLNPYFIGYMVFYIINKIKKKRWVNKYGLNPYFIGYMVFYLCRHTVACSIFCRICLNPYFIGYMVFYRLNKKWRLYNMRNLESQSLFYWIYGLLLVFFRKSTYFNVCINFLMYLFFYLF